MVKFRSLLCRTPRYFLLLGVLLLGWFIAGPTSHNADARPGGGQNYRAPSPSRSYSAPSRSYSSPSRSYSSPSSSYPSSSSTSRGDSSYSRSPYATSSGGPTVVYVPSGGGCRGAGWVVVFLLIIVMVYLYYASKGKTPRERAKIATDKDTAQRGLHALRNQDPEFSPEAFSERTRAVLKTVNEAWLAGDMGPARCLISDGIFVRFSTQLALLKADGLRNAMADWRIISVELLAAEADPQWDTLHAKIVCAARDLDLPLNLSADAARKKLGAAPLAEYQEVWSFVRRRGKHSKKGVPALLGRCPSCGADMPRSDVVRCEYCKTLVNSGEHDWVLAEITQPEEWRTGAATDKIPGLDGLRLRDASVSRQELEDRASVVFWKWIEARTTGKREKLGRFCVIPPTDDASAAVLGIGAVTKLRQVAVGSAELKELVVGDVATEKMDEAVVEIRWSAAVDGAEPAFFIHDFVLARRADAVSKRGMSSLDCPVCGGQLSASDAPICSYCGATLSGGKHEWALKSVRQGELPPDASANEPPADEDLASPGNTALGALGLGLAIASVVADVAASGDDDD